MSAFNPDQALAHFIELHEKRGQEIDRRPDLQRMMDRGHDDEYFCNKMTPQEWKQYLKWEKEE